MKDSNLAISIAAWFIVMIGYAIIALIMAWPTQWLWNNCLVPAVTFAKGITFWQALGINLLSSLLLKTTVNKTKKD